MYTQRAVYTPQPHCEKVEHIVFAIEISLIQIQFPCPPKPNHRPIIIRLSKSSPNNLSLIKNLKSVDSKTSSEKKSVFVPPYVTEGDLEQCVDTLRELAKITTNLATITSFDNQPQLLELIEEKVTEATKDEAKRQQARKGNKNVNTQATVAINQMKLHIKSLANKTNEQKFKQGLSELKDKEETYSKQIKTTIENLKSGDEEGDEASNKCQRVE